MCSSDLTTFALLDKNKDGFLTQAEFNEIVTLGPGGPRPGDNTPTQPQFASPKSATAVKTTERAASPEELAFFESKIRPVLVEKCYKCHAAGEGNKIKGGLALDTREGARKGGDSGPAVVPGDAKKSLLLEAIRYTKNDLQMPPEKDGGKLSDAVIKDFEKWIQTGAADPRTGGPVAKKEYDGLKAKDHWAYQPPKKSPVPAVKNTAWPKTDIDRFVLAKLESEGLAPVADADAIRGAIALALDLHVNPAVHDYAVAILHRTREDSRLSLGASPRAGVVMMRMARARALLAERDFVVPEDVAGIAPLVLAHRVQPSAEARAAGFDAARVIADIVERTPTPL